MKNILISFTASKVSKILGSNEKNLLFSILQWITLREKSGQEFLLIFIDFLSLYINNGSWWCLITQKPSFDVKSTSL